MNVYPAPELVVEVLSTSTRHRDRGVKMEAYALDGVMEHWLADPVKQTVEQYVLEESECHLCAAKHVQWGGYVGELPATDISYTRPGLF